MNNRKKEKEYLLNRINKAKNLLISFKYPLKEYYGFYGLTFTQINKNLISEDLNELVKFHALTSIFESIKKLNYEINYSLTKAIKINFRRLCFNNNNLSKEFSKSEMKIFYYIDNSVYRLSTMWDLLAHLYNQYFETNINKIDIYKKKYFEKYKTYQNIDEYTDFKKKSKNIIKYFNQKDNTSIDGPWKGNHQYIIEYRNKISHRLASNYTSFSNAGVQFKETPVFLLKRISEDYWRVMYFINDFIKYYNSKIE